MKKSLITIVIYVLGLIFSTLLLSLSDAKTEVIAIIGMIWTFTFFVMLFYTEKKILNKNY
tara:strand:+ start:222 stop:401 length:180 start_codon:yes stop_codon:yes gene_type:complete